MNTVKLENKHTFGEFKGALKSTRNVLFDFASYVSSFVRSKQLHIY